MASKSTRKVNAKPSKRSSRPARDELCEMIEDHLKAMHEHMTLREMSESSWVSAATLSRYKNGHGRYLRSDTLRGILRIFGLKLIAR